MSARNSFALIVGALAVYLLGQAARFGVSLYSVQDLLNRTKDYPALHVPGLRESLPSLGVVTSVLVGLSMLVVVACVGILKSTAWALRFWGMTSAALLMSFAAAAVWLDFAWTHFAYVGATVLLSWWYVRQWRRRDAEG